jgi:hypothetical protein
MSTVYVGSGVIVLPAAHSKKIPDQFRAFLRFNPAFDFDAMIQPRMPHQVA